MKKILLLFIATLFLLSLGCNKQKVNDYAMITFMLGNVNVNNDSAEIGKVLNNKDLVATQKGSFCDIKIGDSLIRVKENSKLILSSILKKDNLQNTNLSLKLGKLLCKPKKLLKSENFIVKTPTAVAAVRGTKFLIEADNKKTTRIKVFTGKLKVAKRIKQFEGKEEQVIEISPTLSKEEKVVITQKEVTKAEKIVAKIIKKETKKGQKLSITKIIKKTKKEVVIPKKSIKKFSIDDKKEIKKELKQKIHKAPIRRYTYKKSKNIKKIEKKEDVTKKSEEKIEEIKEEKPAPTPGGKLMITRFQIYYIQNGKVVWEGKLINKPVKKNGKLYVASGSYLFCASTDGPVIWLRRIRTNGKVNLLDDRIVIYSRGKKIGFDLEDGKKL